MQRKTIFLKNIMNFICSPINYEKILFLVTTKLPIQIKQLFVYSLSTQILVGREGGTYCNWGFVPMIEQISPIEGVLNTKYYHAQLIKVGC